MEILQDIDSMVEENIINMMEATCQIDSNTAFSILGDTQIQNAALLVFIVAMDLAIIHYVRFQWSKNQLCKKKTTLTTILQSTCYNTQAHFNSQNLLTESSSSRPRWQLKTDNVYKVDQAVENGGSSNQRELISSRELPLH